MSQVGLARESLESGRLVYEANAESAYAPALALLVSGKPPGKPQRSSDAYSPQAVRGELAALGAPLWDRVPESASHATLEQSLAKACALSHKDPTVAKVLPYLLVLKKDELQFDRFEEALTELKEKHTGGFFLAVACELSGDKGLGVWAEELRDKRRTKVQDFFVNASSKRLRELAERNTPEVARRWSFRLNLALDEFRSVVEKFLDGRQVPG